MANLFPYLPQRLWVGKIIVHSFLISTLDGDRHTIHILVSLPQERNYPLNIWLSARHSGSLGEHKNLSSLHCIEPQPAQPAIYTLYRLHYYHSNTNTVKKIIVNTNLFIFLSHMTIFWDTVKYWFKPLFCVGSKWVNIPTMYNSTSQQCRRNTSVQCKVGTEFLYFTWTAGSKQIINMHQGQYELWRMRDKAFNLESWMAAILVQYA